MGLWACDGLPSSPVIEDPLIVGLITELDVTPDKLRVLVEEDPEVNQPLEPGGSKIWFTIAEETELFDARRVAVTRILPSDLAVNQTVAAVTHGAIKDSYPQQAHADTLVIVQ